MNETTASLSTYLRQMVKENYLLADEARMVARLPEALQEEAVERSEALRVPAMEKIVSDLLNPKPRRETTSLERAIGDVAAFAINGLIAYGCFRGLIRLIQWGYHLIISIG